MPVSDMWFVKANPDDIGGQVGAGVGDGVALADEAAAIAALRDDGAALAVLNCNAAPASAPIVMPPSTAANFVMTIASAQRDRSRNGYASPR